MDDAMIQLGSRLLGAMAERQGLPRPDWQRVQMRWWALPSEAQPAAWTAVEWVWQHTLAASWGGDFRVVQQGECIMTTDLPEEEAQRAVAFMERALATIERCVTGLGLDDYSDGGPGLDVAVVCREVEDYLDYVSDAHEPDYVGAVSGGMCLHQGSVHVAAHGKTAATLEPVMAHELAHSRLAGLGLPVWLEEGLVVHLEKAVAPNEDFANDLHTIALHRAFWTPRRLADFFTGDAFCGPDDAHGLPYALAYQMVGELMQDDTTKLATLLEAAAWEDQGISACEAVYGVPPIELIPRFIRDAAEANAADEAINEPPHPDDDPE
ncbi:hypothetical protein [Algisphaera agarilytica]|uniref:Peptidase MA superfamily protein n=1 Tax=Algisphaera agarilytica TaxID=1385975 RepID=A0A7X0LJ54_9BACT|nr:hypothetical protein [Algisphaera agarilytica]MBB6428492.1 hypothetical protein [Algisphaera agarilytica]